MKITSYLLIILLITSCSSEQVHKKPDFTLTGEKAEKEYRDFSLRYVTTRSGSFQKEGLFTSFKMKDYKDTMEDISPESLKLLEKTKTHEYVLWGLWGAWLATAFIRTDNNQVSPLYWWGAGATLGYAFYLDHRREEVIDQYQKDLKAKFATSIGYNFSF